MKLICRILLFVSTFSCNNLQTSHQVDISQSWIKLELGLNAKGFSLQRNDSAKSTYQWYINTLGICGEFKDVEDSIIAGFESGLDGKVIFAGEQMANCTVWQFSDSSKAKYIKQRFVEEAGFCVNQKARIYLIYKGRFMILLNPLKEWNGEYERLLQVIENIYVEQ